MNFGKIAFSPWKAVTQEEFDNALKAKNTVAQVSDFLDPPMKFYWDASVELDTGTIKYKTAIAAIALSGEKGYFIKKSLLKKD